MSAAPIRTIFFRRLNLLALAATLLFCLFLFVGARLLLEGGLRDKGESLGRVLAAVTLDAVMVHDYATLERYVRDIVADPAVAALTVQRHDGEILAAAGSPPDDSEILEVVEPVAIGDRGFGEVRIHLATDRVRRITATLLLVAVAAGVIFHFLAVALANLALSRAVGRPLAVMEAAIARLRQGDFRAQVTVAEPLEFATIGAAFNDMTATIRDTIATIDSQRARLEVEQNKLATIVDSMADGLFVTDHRGTITAFNRAATAITGYTEDEAIGRRCADLFRTSLCADACALYHAGHMIRNRETTLYTKDGRLLQVAVSSACIRDANGGVVGGVQTFRDITEDKRRQELYCHTEKLAAIGQLAAGVAHEINNPLSNILGYARAIKPEADAADIARRVEIIVEQTRKCSRIVQGLLNFSRASQAAPDRFDLRRLLARTRDMLAYQAGKKQIAVHLATPPQPLVVYADGRKIEQVAVNLLLNAIQAVSGPGNVWLEAGRAGRAVYLTVADDGPGIPEEVRPRIFDPFFTTKPVGEGTGLGLSICAGIVAEADGSIEVGERPGGGAVFTVYLPAAADTNPPEEP